MSEKKQPEVIRKRAVPLAATSHDVVEQQVVQILKIALQGLLLEPKKIGVNVIRGENTTIFEVDIGPQDYGRLLGSRGKTISALRTLTLAITANHGFRSVIQVKDEDRFFQK